MGAINGDIDGQGQFGFGPKLIKKKHNYKWHKGLQYCLIRLKKGLQLNKWWMFEWWHHVSFYKTLHYIVVMKGTKRILKKQAKYT